MLKTKYYLFTFSCFLSLFITSCSTTNTTQHPTFLNEGKATKNMLMPPTETGQHLLVDDNSDYLMVIDKSTIAPTTITLDDNSKKDVIQAWVYMFYKTLYAPVTYNDDEKPYKTNKYLTYFSLADKTGAIKIFYFYDEDNVLFKTLPQDLQESDFQTFSSDSIGEIQFDIIQASQERDK